MIHNAGDRVEVSGAMTLPTASTLLEEGTLALVDLASPENSAAESRLVIDLAAVTEVDSSALALVFAWLREAQGLGKTLGILHPPQQLLSLAGVYGVTELLPLD